tara:strand:- start:19046 stop:19333 length:288 start_codon:yes stop_codon:yes gene_type:complete
MKPNVSISNPCPKKEIPVFSEKTAEIRYAAGSTHATSATEFAGSAISPRLSREIRNKKNAARTLMKIKRDFVNENGTESDGIKNIGRRNIIPTIK